MQNINTSILHFSFKILEAILSNSENNQSSIISPFSIYELLSIVLNGSARKTKSQFEEVLECEKYTSTFNTEMEKLGKELEITLRKDVLQKKDLINSSFDPTIPDNKFRISNFVFYRNNVELNKQFIDVCIEKYKALVMPIDLTDRNESLSLINDCVSTATEGMIPKLLDSLSMDLKILLVNTIYFKGTWAKQFDKKDTKLMPFFSGSNKKEVLTMTQTDEFMAFENDEYQSIRMAYLYSDYALIAVMPKNESELYKVNKHLSKDSELAKLINNMERYYVSLDLPKFKIESDIELSDILKKVGVTEFFNNPDLSNMMTSGHDGIKIKQKVLIDVNELGTVAAAATSALMSDGGCSKYESKTIKLNKPFLYYLVRKMEDAKNISYLPVFMGVYRG